MQDFITQKMDLFTITLLRTTNSAAKSAFLQIYAGMYQDLRWEQGLNKFTTSLQLQQAIYETFIYCRENVIADCFAGCSYIFPKALSLNLINLLTYKTWEWIQLYCG